MQHLYSKLSIKAVAVLLLLGGCAASESTQSPELQVAARAQERIEALMTRDLERALEYTTPSFRRSITPRAYGGRYAGAANFTGATVQRVECEEETCNVRILISYQLARPRIENTRPFDEVWVLVDGQWYIYES